MPDPLTFRLAARLSGLDRQLQAGEYRFAEPASPFKVVSRLAAGDVYARPVTFPEGLTIKEMAAVFERGGLGSARRLRGGRGRSRAGRVDRSRSCAASRATCFPTPTRCRAGPAPTPPFVRWSTRFGQVFDDRLEADAQAIGLTSTRR